VPSTYNLQKKIQSGKMMVAKTISKVYIPGCYTIGKVSHLTFLECYQIKKKMRAPLSPGSALKNAPPAMEAKSSY